MSPSEITILKVYDAVNPNSLDKLIGKHPNPSLNCPIGCKIYEILEEPYNEISKAVEVTMSKYTLADLIVRYKAI